MNVARVIITDRGDLYLPHMRASMDQYVDYPWSITITIDDRSHHYGMAGAVRAAWDLLPEDTDFVFHCEEDFVFRQPVPVDHICKTLEYNTHLAQIVLKRQPWSAEEQAAGGIIECHPDDYEDQAGWVEHSRIFSLNPCVYPYWITRVGWPDGNEAEFTQRMLNHGMRFAFWGSRADPPMVIHIGTVRARGWRL